MRGEKIIVPISGRKGETTLVDGDPETEPKDVERIPKPGHKYKLPKFATLIYDMQNTDPIINTLYRVLKDFPDKEEQIICNAFTALHESNEKLRKECLRMKLRHKEPGSIVIPSKNIVVRTGNGPLPKKGN